MSKKAKIFFVILFIAIAAIVIGITSYAAYVVNSTDVSYTPTSGSQTSVKAALDDLYTKANSGAKVKYHAGDVVTFSGEQFQVLNDVIEGQMTCEIFCKTNLNTGATAQANAAYSTTKCVFSSTNYWSSSWVSGTKLNLNGYPGYTATDAMGKVNTYVRTKGAIGGRLLTYDEANTMKSSSNTAVKNMFKGTGNTAQNFENYWLGSSYEGNGNRVYRVSGSGGIIYGSTYYDGSSFGVRPVLTVFVSQLS